MHLGGAHRDNRIVPYEGLDAASDERSDSAGCWPTLRANISPPCRTGRARRASKTSSAILAETHFCWIGGAGEADALSTTASRARSLFIEFDMHSGVFLTNREPAKFHVHTIVRTPNGNDYGIDLLRQHYRRSHKGGADRGHGHSHGHGHDHG